MELQYYGANCLRIITKKTSIVVDDNLVDIGLKSILKDGEVLLVTGQTELNSNKELKLLVNQPGDYEVSDVSVLGIPARAYKDEPNGLNNTIYKIEFEDTNVVVFGNSFPDLTDTQLEMLGEVQVLVIPVGNNDVTLSGVDALKVIRKIEPYVVIPTHYADPSFKYSVEQNTLEDAIKELSMEPKETLNKYKIKSNTYEEDQATSLIVLERS
jgi:L-ascorbate metabolism protein UlaG (beta-lactamase superfamily)